MKTRRQRKAAKVLAQEIKNSLPKNSLLSSQNLAIIQDPKTLQPISCTKEQAIEAIKSTSVDGYEFEDVVNMFATYIQRLCKLSTQKKKPQRKPAAYDRLQNIQIFENIQKKRKLSSPAKSIPDSVTGTYEPVSHHYLEGRTQPHQSSVPFFEKENQFNSPQAQASALFFQDSTFKTLQNSNRFNSISPDGYREYFSRLQESPFVSDFHFLKPEPKVEPEIAVKMEEEEVKSISTNQLSWLENITPEDMERIMNTLKMEPPVIKEEEEEEEKSELLMISPRFYESPPKSRKALLQNNIKVKNSMINSYISYLIYADHNHLDSTKLQKIYPTFSMIFDDILQRNLTEKSTGIPIPPQSEGFTLRREGSWSFSKEESDFEISSPLLIREESDEEIEVYREFSNSQVEVEAVVNEENFVKPVMADKKLESETLCLKMVHDTILKSHLPAQTSQPASRPTFFREISFDAPQQEVHFGENSNRMVIEDGQLLRDHYDIENFAEIFQVQEEDEENVSMVYEEKSSSHHGVDELEGDVVVCETKEDAKQAYYDEEYYQARANNVYYVVSVLLVAIVAKLYMSLFRMYSLRNI